MMNFFWNPNWELENPSETISNVVLAPWWPRTSSRSPRRPLTWRAEADIPARQWLYGKHLLRQYVSVDIAAGGIGKSSLKIGEALAMASNQDLYGQGIHDGPYKVWLYNLEDSGRRNGTAHSMRPPSGSASRRNDLEGRLFADTGRDQPLMIAEETPSGVRINSPVVEAIVSEIIERGIDVLVVDPFVSSHAVTENDNNKIDAVAKLWVKIAGRCNCSINLVHHVRKQNGQEANAESGRGAVALIGAARSVAVYNRMNKDDASQLGVPEEEARFYFRVENDKANLAPPEKAVWYRMNNQDLDNGDKVGVACPWKAPDPFEGITPRHVYDVQKAIGEGEWRENVQTKDKWVGVAVARILCLDIEDKRDRGRITSMLRTWLKAGLLEVVEKEDSKRMVRKFVVPGKWIEL
jgi:hypothetical protein